MELIIQEILEKITSHCEKGLEEFLEKSNICDTTSENFL